MSRINTIEILVPGPPGGGLSQAVADTLYPPKAATETAINRVETREYDVRKYGAVGDGLTDYTVETAGFQAAIAAAGDDWVVVPPGTYQLGTIAVTSVMRIRLEEGARLLVRGGAHSDPLFDFTGTELVIRGPGVIDGNRHNNVGTIAGRPPMVNGDCQEGKSIDIEGVHFTGIMLGVTLRLFGGYLNFSHNTITDHGQHQQIGGATSTIVSIISGQIDAVSPLIRTNFNRATFTDTVDAPGTAPGGFFVATSNQPTTPLEQGTPAKWEAIGNYFYGYGQNHSTNEIGCLHSYPSPAQCRFIGNHFEHFPITPISAKSVTDFICVGNTFLDGVINDAYVPDAGTVIYAPGYHANTIPHYRAVIANNIIKNGGGTAAQGAAGIVVNAQANSVAREVVIANNSVAVDGSGISLSWVENAHASDNVLTTLGATPGSRRGITLTNMVGDIECVDNLIDVENQGIAAITTTGTGGRIHAKGNTITSSGGCIDLRGVELAVVLGNTVRRVGGSTAINVTTDGANPVGTCVYDRTNHVLEGTINLSHANITAFQGQEPLTVAPGISPGGAAGTGATGFVTGDGDKGLISLTTGTSPTTGGVATIDFVDRRTAPMVFLSPANTAAALAFDRVYVGTATTSLFIVSVVSAALTASTEYQWRYQIA